MWYRLLADLVVGLHAAFVLFALCGGWLIVKWPRVAWVHVPAVAWGVMVECTGWVCPLTPLENWVRAEGGGLYDEGDFIPRYVLPVLYPAEFSRQFQLTLGTFLAAVNAGIYGWLIRRYRTGN